MKRYGCLLMIPFEDICAKKLRKIKIIYVRELYEKEMNQNTPNALPIHFLMFWSETLIKAYP